MHPQSHPCHHTALPADTTLSPPDSTHLASSSSSLQNLQNYIVMDVVTAAAGVFAVDTDGPLGTTGKFKVKK